MVTNTRYLLDTNKNIWNDLQGKKDSDAKSINFILADDMDRSPSTQDFTNSRKFCLQSLKPDGFTGTCLPSKI